MNNYNWSQAILDNLMKSVEAYATKLKDVAGCVMLLLLLDGRLQQIEREVQVFRTVRNNQTTSNINHGSSEHDDSSVSPENDDEHDNESQDANHGSNDNDNESQCGEDHRSTEKDGEDDFRNVQLLDGSLQQTNHDDDDGSSKHDDSGGIPENDDHDDESQDDDHGTNERESGEDHASTGKHGEDHGSAEDDDDITNEHGTPVILLTLVHYYHKTDLKN
ncbi:hypothetical protein RHMOL_Rhmol13G0131800 [Rhododendron molle]|uniref:Uncharacterized protein n=1 Tax=Rhododendron molle TaxID=49168 RepID=A0ACC0L7L2_RHOML|nr:hypothetical protein RHMOL_Rhmol13G0131800 [Rhododendron molle]